MVAASAQYLNIELSKGRVGSGWLARERCENPFLVLVPGGSSGELRPSMSVTSGATASVAVPARLTS